MAILFNLIPASTFSLPGFSSSHRRRRAFKILVSIYTVFVSDKFKSFSLTIIALTLFAKHILGHLEELGKQQSFSASINKGMSTASPSNPAHPFDREEGKFAFDAVSAK